MSLSDQLHSQLTAQTTLPETTVRELVAATAARSGGFSFGAGSLEYAKIIVTGQPQIGTTLAIKAPGGRTLTTILVAIENDGTHTNIAVGVRDASVIETRGAFFIPVAPKRMAGYATYRKFLTNFTAALRGSDANVTVAQA